MRHLVEIMPDAPLHIHVAEQTKEVEDCLAWSGQRPVEWLLSHLPVNNRWCLIHATHMTEGETQAMARTGAVAGLCPLTEANLGDGIFPAPLYRQHGGRFGIGTDSNVRLSMPGELEMLEYGQRLANRARNVLSDAAGQSTGRTMFDAALSGGAQACGLGAAGLSVGASADFITLKASHPALAAGTRDFYCDAMIFARHDLIDSVWRNGVQVVTGGVHHKRNEIALRFKAVIGKLGHAS